MTNSVKNRIMRILAVIAIVCVGMVIAFAVKPAKAEQTVAEKTEFAVQTEASVYIGGDLSGIAFKTDVDKTYYESIKTDSNTIEFYTIVTAEKMLNGGDLSLLTVETASQYDAVIIATNEAIKFDDETWTYQVAITYEDAGLSEEQLEKAYQTKLVARSYLKITDGDDESVVYANANGKATSIREVAQAHLADAIKEEAVLSEENVTKLINYAGKKDVNAYFEVAGEVEFIDQNLNGAVVYVVNSTADGFDSLGEIQNGKLESTAIALGQTAGAKTEVVVVNGDNAFLTDLTQVTKIIRNASDFKEVFWTPTYHVSVTHSITYNGQTLTETFTDTENLDKLYKTNGRVYLNLSDDFVTKLANGATRNADSETVTAEAVNGYYVLADNIGDLGTNDGTYCYNFKLGVVTASRAKEGAVADASKWGTDSYDNAGYRYAGNNAYYHLQYFTGTFDGLGHYVNGFVSNTQGGLFGTLENATIKNVAFTGVESGKDGTSTGIIAYQNRGEGTVIENVYIQVDSLPSLELGTTAGNVVRWGALYYNNHSNGTKSSTVKNVVIEMPTRAWDTTATFGAGIIGSSTANGGAGNPITENVVAITGTDLVSGYGQNYRVWVAENDAVLIEDGGKYASFNSKNVQEGLNRYDDMATAVKNNAFANFTANCWRLTDNGIEWKAVPVDAGTYIYSAKDNTIPELLTENIGGEIYSVVDGAGNELLVNGMLTIENDTNDVVDYNLVVKSTSGVYSIELLAYTDIIDSADEFNQVFLSPNYHFSVTHNIELADGSTYSETVSDTTHPELLTINADNSRYLKLSATAREKLALEGSSRLADTNRTVSADSRSGAYALGADLTINNGRTSSYGGMWRAYGKVAAIQAVSNNTDDLGYKIAGQNAFLQSSYFTGTFDGFGHVIDATISSQGGLFGYLNGATIKNVAVDAVITTDTTAVFGNNATTSSTIKDVYVEVDFAGNRNGGFINQTNSAYTLQNAVIVSDYDAEITAHAYGMGIIGQLAYAGGSNNMSNVYAITPQNFLSSYMGGTDHSGDRVWVAGNEAELVESTYSAFGVAHVATGIKRYDNITDLGLAGNNFSTFNASYWDTSTGIPVWKSLADEVVTDWRDEVNKGVKVQVDGVVVEEITFTDTDSNSKTFALYSEALELDFTKVDVDDERVVTYADGKITKVGVGATKIVYEYELFGKKYSGTILVSVTQGAFLKGEGAPDASLGLDGDTYLDTATNDVYNKENGEWILAGNMDGDISLRIDDGLVQDTTIYTVGSFMGNTYKNYITASVIKNAQTEKAEIIILSNEDLVSVNQETGVITAVGEGQVEIRIRYENATNGLVFAEDMVLTIVKPVANYNEKIEMFSALDGDLPLVDIFGEEVKLVSAKNLSDPTNELTVTDNKVLGLKTIRTGATTARLELESQSARMIVDIEGYTLVIDEAKDFALLNLSTITTVIDGYFYLNNDIAYDSTAPVNIHSGASEATAYFAGVFEGNGHKITLGVANYGIFGRLGKGAVIKNTGFINTVFTSNSGSAFVLAYRLGGTAEASTTITNCYFEQKDFRSSVKGNRTAIIGQSRSDKLLLDNVVFNVDMPDNMAEAAYGGGLLFCYDSNWTSGTDYLALSYYLRMGITNCYVVGDFKYMARIYATDHYRSYYAENEGIANDGYESFTYLGINRYDTFEDLGDDNTSKWQYVNGEVIFVAETDCFIPETSYKLFGRAQELGDSYKFQLPNSGIEFAFSGTNLEVKLKGAGNSEAKVRIFIDDDTDGDIIFLDKNVYTYTKTGLAEGNHTVRIINAYEEGTGFELVDVKVDKFASIDKSDKLRIQILGDSITTGYGATKESGSVSHSIENSDSTLSYSYLVPLMLDADFSIVARQGITVAKPGSTNMLHLYENYSLTNSNTAVEEEFDVVIVNLGTNDASATTEEYRAEFPEYYKQLLTQIRRRNPNAKIVCVFNMMIRSNVDVIEAGILQAVEEMNDANIYTKLDFTHAVSGHPNRYEHQANAEILVDYLKDLLNIA